MKTRPKLPQRITNSVMAYQWGVFDGISKRLNLAPSGAAEAEIWIGSHPKAPSRFNDGQTLLDYELASGEKLPFLLKMLAVNEALSIQAHPTKECARAGFASEEAAGVKITAESRNYRDCNAKPELIVALETGFEALCGFRDPQASAALLTELAGDAHNSVRQFADRIVTQGVEEVVRWALSADSAGVSETIEHLYVAALAAQKNFTADTPGLKRLCALIADLTEKYPGDPGILVAVLLNIVCLKHGEALWLPPGTPHAYLRGYGIEIMGPSDNVLRGGLTPKHIDTAELLQVLNFDPRSADPIAAVAAEAAAQRFNPDAAGEHSTPFELVRVLKNVELVTSGVSCILVVSGSFTVEITDAAGAHKTLQIKTGQTFALPEGAIKLTGSGEAFLASGALRGCDAPAAQI
ncbi:mannose-6-phosphate isomerase, class I [Canibacter zhoujuaniae]|uniref:mannose-6-phosphate isomerase, class I n=1 Tax=Canibacter zhoujuaniae TaxID=2708343 RepID=UPI0014204E35|nr:mannose-6-phosphate isomerase, class I [Canibacter zhoujuaniae]